MGNLKAKMLNQKAADPKNKPNEILNSIGLKLEHVIADIGSEAGVILH